MTLPRCLIPVVLVLGIAFGVIDPRSSEGVIGLTPLGWLLDDAVRFLFGIGD
jgi:hypothetical protein